MEGVSPRGRVPKSKSAILSEKRERWGKEIQIETKKRGCRRRHRERPT